MSLIVAKNIMQTTMGLSSAAGCLMAGISLTLWISAVIGPVGALRLNRIEVPQLQDYRDRAWLRCEYELISTQMNSVKWYKDGSEFFRFSPLQEPLVSQFRVAGVQLYNDSTSCDQSTCQIFLINLQPQTSGVYRCEVSGDAPDFKLVSGSANLTVGALPQRDPQIVGLQTQYAFGDFVQADCLADKSSPAATISWTINDVPILLHKLQPIRYSAIEFVGGFPLQNRSQEISYYIDQTDWGMARRLTLRCTAVIDGFPKYRRSSERLIDVNVANHNERLVNPKNAGDRTAAAATSGVHLMPQLLAICAALLWRSCAKWL